ncbi:MULTISPECIES: flavin prenyltransferase UbiX [Vitreoscilla]|nr:decarboxylase UbiX/Pad1 [Vitreoscilla sp. C1]
MMLSTPIQTVTLGLTGASGMPYGIRLLECLLRYGKTVWLVYSQAAQIVAQQEMGLQLPSSPSACEKMLHERYGVDASRLRVFGQNQWSAPPASGTHVADAMVVCPATMGMVAAIAYGTSDHLLERAADVCIKEGRPLIIVPREAPFSALHLENLLKLARLGVCVLPPSPGFYQHPKTIEDIIDFVVARILDQLRIEHDLLPRWGEE